MESNELTPAQPVSIPADLSRAFMTKVFGWMFAGLSMSAAMAWLFASTELIYLLIGETSLNPLGYVCLFAPLGMVMAMGLGWQRLSKNATMALFVAYCLVNGISLSFILLAYTGTSIVACFASAATMFGIMAVMGAATKTDLTKFGSILMMGLVGILVGFLINFFLGSEQFDYILSLLGVLIFTGLTAYDVQKLIRIGAGVEYEGETKDKLAIMGALNLYLDFINLFLMLLRLFGRRK